MTQRDVMGREVGEGFRIGNMRTPVADSCWCMEKPIQYCKVISLQLKTNKQTKKNLSFPLGNLKGSVFGASNSDLFLLGWSDSPRKVSSPHWKGGFWMLVLLEMSGLAFPACSCKCPLHIPFSVQYSRLAFPLFFGRKASHLVPWWEKDSHSSVE